MVYISVSTCFRLTLPNILSKSFQSEIPAQHYYFSYLTYSSILDPFLFAAFEPDTFHFHFNSAATLLSISLLQPNLQVSFLNFVATYRT